MNTNYQSLVTDNIPFVHWLMNKRFSFIKRYSALDYEEATAEAFSALCRAAKAYIKSEDDRPFLTYARTAIINAVYTYNAANTKMRQLIPIGDAGLETPDRHYVNASSFESGEYCHDLIQKAQLVDTEKEIIRLFYWDDKSYRQIADKLNMPESKVRGLLVRIKRTLKEASKVKYAKRTIGSMVNSISCNSS